MTVDCADVILPVLWAEAYSMTGYIKYCLPHSPLKLKKLLYKLCVVINLQLSTYSLLVQNPIHTYLKRNRTEYPSIDPEEYNILL
jgi:hypothetical protein